MLHHLYKELYAFYRKGVVDRGTIAAHTSMTFDAADVGFCP